MLNEIALNYLWKLFLFKFNLKDDGQTKNLISALYDKALDLPDELDSLLLNYWRTWDENYLVSALKLVVQRYFFDAERHVILVALLNKETRLTTKELKDLLLLPGKNLAEIHPAIKNVIDTAWLINQNELVGLAASPKDSLLENALSEALSDFVF